jgi:hypothetical protein
MSIGLLISQQWGYRSVEDLLHETDMTLYAAKAAGRNCVKMAVPRVLPSSEEMVLPETLRKG